MKKMTRSAFLVCVVSLIVVAAMASTLQAAAPYYIEADDPGWVLSPAAPANPSLGWSIEDYTTLPEEFAGPMLLVANDAGATATYNFVGGKHFEVYSSKYWTCGNIEVWADGKLKATVNLYLDADAGQPEQLVFTGAFPGKPDDGKKHTLMIKPAGTGGPGIVTYVDYETGETHTVDLSWLHFANVQHVYVY